MKKIVIVGNGGFAKEVKWLIDRINAKSRTWDFLGYVDEKVEGESIFGDDEKLINYTDELNVAIAIGSSPIRRKIIEKYNKNSKLFFPNLIDPSVIVSNQVSYGKGNIICAGTIITVDILIGDFNIINLDCTVGHDAIIKDYVTVNPSVNISGNTIINSGVNIGTGTQIIQGKTIGQNTIIGAGAVVVKDIPDNCTAVGSPAKPIKFHDE